MPEPMTREEFIDRWGRDNDSFELELDALLVATIAQQAQRIAELERKTVQQQEYITHLQGRLEKVKR